VVEYKQEPLFAVVGEIEPLIQNHFKEVDPTRDYLNLDLDWDTYLELERLGQLMVFTCRVDSRLVGYLSVLVSPDLHSKGEFTPCEDGLFVDKSYRGLSVAKNLISFAEKCLKEDGFKVFYLTGTIENPIGSLLESVGYKPVETKYQKVL